jgi:hypothetical protein
VREMMRLMNARISAEVAWSQQFIERLRNHEYMTADEPAWQPAATSATARRDGPRYGRASAPPGRGSGQPRRTRRTPDRTGNASGAAAARGPRRARGRGDRAPDGTLASPRSAERDRSRGERIPGAAAHANPAAARGRGRGVRAPDASEPSRPPAELDPHRRDRAATSAPRVSARRRRRPRPR